MLNRENRLTKPKDFSSLYNRGKKAVGNYVVVYFRKKSAGPNRIGFTVSKKVGNAVTRNRVKRRLQEIVRNHPISSEMGMDFVIIARSSAVSAAYHELKKDVEALLNQEAPYKGSIGK